MPTNLPPEALVAEEKYSEATTLPEKIRTLQDFISKVPKHKGTEKLLSILKTRLAKLKDELETSKKARRGGGRNINIRKEGAAQVVLIGLTNCGRSSLLSKLTGANVKIADYPFTTKEPEVGMINYEGALIQLVEAPAIFENLTDNIIGPPIFSIIRNADCIAVVIDLSDDPYKQMRIIREELEKNDIKINVKPPAVKVKKTGSGGLQFLGLQYFKGDKEDLNDILKEAGVYNATIRFLDTVTLPQFAEVLDEKIVYRPAIIIANKGDADGSVDNYSKLEQLVNNQIDIIPVSALKDRGLEQLKSKLFRVLSLIRIYTKETDGSVSPKPLVLKKDSTVNDVAKRLHAKFINRFKFAKVFGPSAKFPGEKVGLDHKLLDGDIIQIFTQ